MNALLDSHCHITCDRLYGRIEEVLVHAQEQNIEKMMIICTNFIEYERARKLADQDARFQVALGFHPNELYSFQESDYIKLEALLADNKLDALGEIGLDYHWDDVKKEDQTEGFIRQIELANKYQYPILIHMRDATKDCIDVLKNYAKTKFVLHCFSGSSETAKEVMRMGGYISFAGPLTFKNARGLTEVPAVCDLDKILIETDCPYLTPHPHRGKENEPMFVRYTFEKLCTLLDLGEERLSEQIKKNYDNFLKR